MGIEAATYVSDLVTTNPLATDPTSQGDNQLRLIKKVLKKSLPVDLRNISSPNSGERLFFNNSGEIVQEPSSRFTRVVCAAGEAVFLNSGSFVTLPVSNSYSCTNWNVTEDQNGLINNGVIKLAKDDPRFKIYIQMPTITTTPIDTTKIFIVTAKLIRTSDSTPTASKTFWYTKGSPLGGVSSSPVERPYELFTPQWAMSGELRVEDTFYVVLDFTFNYKDYVFVGSDMELLFIPLGG